VCVGIWIGDDSCHGPWAVAFNQRCQERAQRADLVGRPERDVPDVMGPASSVWRYWSETDLSGQPVVGASFIVTYNYAPCPFVPAGVFQVHCVGGVVESLEQLDD
jgi:hypothetical protein